MTYTRPISANEMLYVAGEAFCPPFAINLVVEAEGTLDVRQLEQAVAAAAQACPGARIVARKGQWVDTGRAPPVRTVADCTACFADPLDPVHGPTCEVVVAPGAVLLRVSHAAMDGKGSLRWIEDVFRALRGEQPLGAPDAVTDQQLLARLGSRGQRQLQFECEPPFARSGGSATDFVWKRRTLPGSHPGLVAKLAAVLSEQRALRIMVPVDMRRHDPAISATGNLSMPIFLDTHAGEPWEALHARLLAELAACGELRSHNSDALPSFLPNFGLKALIRAALAMQKLRGKYLLASAIISHLGKLDLALFSAPGFAARTVYSLPVHAPLAPLSLVSAECGDRVELSLACSRGWEREADALLDRIVLRLAPAARPVPQGRRTALSERTLSELFQEQAARTPDALALVQGAQQLSYRELDERSSALAGALAGQGVAVGDVVGLLVDRSIAGVVALWAVLKAGAAYLPLDPSYPDARIASMLEDSGAAVCVAEQSHAARARALFHGRVVDPETLDAAAPLVRATQPDSLAYIIYTSGSTGRPKGVQVEHRSLINYVQWARGAYGLDAHVRFALFTSLAFDLSVTSLIAPLLCGGSVALIAQELDHLTLEHVLMRAGVNALKLTPTHLALMARLSLAPAGFRLLVVGGEQLAGDVAARAQAQFGPDCRIFNEYGPTEATVGCVVHEFGALDAHAAAVPIGLPIDNTRIHLLDAHGAAVAHGARGEIYIAGDCLARGYHQREELNRERFVMLPEGRAYRTGDLARVRDDGVLEFLGRGDDQIKIRGHRIEPGEVESVLREHPRISQALVLGRTRAGSGDKVLCAHVATDLPEAEVRSYLASRLPAALVPTFLETRPALPLTVNGKIDASALTSPFDLEPQAAHAVRESGDQLELNVRAIWQRLLGVDASQLGPDSDFHRLGGDSLQMVEMLAAVAKQLGTGERAFMANVRELVRAPTLERVCRAADLAEAGS